MPDYTPSHPQDSYGKVKPFASQEHVVDTWRRQLSDKLPNPLDCHPVPGSRRPSKSHAVAAMAARTGGTQAFPPYNDPFQLSLTEHGRARPNASPAKGQEKETSAYTAKGSGNPIIAESPTNTHGKGKHKSKLNPRASVFVTPSHSHKGSHASAGPGERGTRASTPKQKPKLDHVHTDKNTQLRPCETQKSGESAPGTPTSPPQGPVFNVPNKPASDLLKENIPNLLPPSPRQDVPSPASSQTMSAGEAPTEEKSDQGGIKGRGTALVSGHPGTETGAATGGESSRQAEFKTGAGSRDAQAPWSQVPHWHHKKLSQGQHSQTQHSSKPSAHTHKVMTSSLTDCQASFPALNDISADTKQGKNKYSKQPSKGPWGSKPQSSMEDQTGPSDRTQEMKDQEVKKPGGPGKPTVVASKTAIHVPDTKTDNENESPANIKSEADKTETPAKLDTMSPSKYSKRKGKQVAILKGDATSSTRIVVDSKPVVKTETTQSSSASELHKGKGKKNDNATKSTAVTSTTTILFDDTPQPSSSQDVAKPKSTGETEITESSRTSRLNKDKGKRTVDATRGNTANSTTTTVPADDKPKAPSAQADSKREEKPQGESGPQKKSNRGKGKRRGSAAIAVPTTTRSRMPTLSGDEFPSVGGSSSAAPVTAAKAPTTSAWGVNSPKSIREPAPEPKH
ncbi:hypothetical protein SCUP234_12266 [Seiridium cupressi]